MTANYASLVNETNIRASIKRLFGNEACETLAELFQNSQRAGATTVAITTNPSGVIVIEDNGHGVAGLDGLHALLRMAESAYADPAVAANQHPMGLGIHALFAHDQVNTITIRSGSLALMAIDTKRWWNDPAYYQNWTELVLEMPETFDGLQIAVTCSPKLVAEVVAALPLAGTENPGYQSSREFPACGYSGRLAITLNDRPVYTDVPDSWQGRAILETTYQGSRLVVQARDGKESLVNWYGQLVRVNTSATLGFDLSFYLEVTTGRPLNLKSPVRSGAIIDDAYLALVAFIKAAVVEYACSHPEPAVAAVKAAYAYDSLQTACRCPFYVVKPVVENDYEYNKLDTQAPVLDRYDAPAFTVFDENVSVWYPDGTTEDFDEGFLTFLQAFGLPAARWGVGDKDRVPTQTLWWKLGGPIQHEHFVSEPGHWAIAPEKVDPPAVDAEVWQSVPEGTLLAAFDSYQSYDITDVSGLVLAPNPVDFLGSAATSVFFQPDPNDWDKSTDDYNASAAAWRRELMGSCVAFDWTLADLKRHVPAGVQILSIAPVWGQSSYHPDKLVVTPSTGDPIELRIA